MPAIHEIIKRDIRKKVEGVVKVFDRASIANDIAEYVVTDKIEEELKRVFDTFALASQTLRLGGHTRDVMGVWVSGFFGSGKSHFAKVLGHLLQNTTLDASGAERCIDSFVEHLSDTPRGREVRMRLGEIKLHTDIRTIFFEIKSRQSLSNPNSVGEILLSEFYRSIGLAENFVVARIERRLQQRGLLDKLEAAYERAFGVPWASLDGRDDLMTVRRRLGQILPEVDASEYPDEKVAKQALGDMFRHEQITAEGIADELTSWVVSQKPTGGKVAHLVFVIDEMGTFIGDSNDRISELNSIAEMIGNKGKGRVWLAVTSQQDLEKVVDRTNFQPALVGRLNARFELKPHLISDEINKVVSERILKKKPAQEGILQRMYRDHEGPITQLADLKASRHLGTISERGFVDSYPFLPHQVRLAQDIFEALSGFRISGGVRSMISVVMEALQDVADDEVGLIIGFDQVFDAVKNDLLSQEYLGASGVLAISESANRVTGTPIDPSRVLKVLWLIQRVTWVPRIPETLAKLLARRLDQDIPVLRGQVEETLFALQEAGYVARDEATREWKFLSERERTIEQAIQEMIRPGGTKSISLAAVRRTSQQICKDDLVTRKKLGNFSIGHGTTKISFAYGVHLDGEAVETGPDLELRFVSPLAPGRAQETEAIRRDNQAAGAKGRIVWWVAATPDELEARLKRYEALVKVTGDKRFVDDASSETQDALAEKRRERDDLRGSLVRDLERAFMAGTIFYLGQEVELEGGTDLKDPIAKAMLSVIPNVYPRFGVADRPFDFSKQLKAILNPSSSNLHSVAPELELFDTQGSLQRESALVSQVLEVIRDIEDEGHEPIGSALVDAKDAKGFKGFLRPPFGWPEELVRLVLAACFRAGAVYLEHQSGSGPAPVYDYRGSEEVFSKVNTFRKVAFRLAETSLSVDQIKQASKALIALGCKGVAESGNAIAAAVRELGTKLDLALSEAKLRQQQGLPIPEDVLGAEESLKEPTTVKDPTVAVISFLSVCEQWKALQKGLASLRSFIEADRLKDFEASRGVDALAETHPIPEGHSQAEALEEARKDMAAIIAEKSVITRWPDYREAFERAFSAYREAYLEAYSSVSQAIENTISSIKQGEAYLEAPADKRDAVLDRVFGSGRPCHYPPITLPTVSNLLEATTRRSLTSLEQALVALPGYRSQIEAELRELSSPPLPPGEQICEWRPTYLVGKRLRTEEEVDEAVDTLASDLKARIREGYTVVVR